MSEKITSENFEKRLMKTETLERLIAVDRELADISQQMHALTTRRYTLLEERPRLRSQLSELEARRYNDLIACDGHVLTTVRT